MEINHGDKIQVWTFSGWEDVDWDFVDDQDDMDMIASSKVRMKPAEDTNDGQ